MGAGESSRCDEGGVGQSSRGGKREGEGLGTCLIFCFSDSTIRNFSMLNSSSALSLISAAFSDASW